MKELINWTNQSKSILIGFFDIDFLTAIKYEKYITRPIERKTEIHVNYKQYQLN